MRILIVCGIFPPDIGGPARYIPTVAKALLARGHAVSVVTLADDPAASGALEWSFAVHRIKRRQFMPWRILRTIWTVVQLGRSSEVILANTLGLEAAIGGLLARRPVIHKVVGDYAWERARSKGWFSGTIDDYQRARPGWRLWLLNLWRTTPLRLATHIFVPSEYLARMVRAWNVPAGCTSVIYNSYARPAQGRPRPPGGGSETIVLTVCRLVAWKHVDGIIAAIANLDQTVLWIVGEGPLRSALERQVAATPGLAARVVFFGQLPADDVMTRMHQADIFVLNSSYEGLPHVVIEAMGAGLPVVATRAGGTPELVRTNDTGLLVEVGEQPQLEVALRAMIESPAEARRLGENGRKLVETQFSLVRMVFETEKLLESHARR